MNLFRFLTIGAAVITFAACSGKNTKSTSTAKIGGAGVAQVRAALTIFERAGFHDLVVYSNIPAQRQNIRAHGMPLKERRWFLAHLKDTDWIHTRGYSNGLTAPLSAVWWKTLPPKASPEKLRKLLGAMREAFASSPDRKTRDQLRAFEFKRLTYVRVCNHWIITSYDSGRDPTLHARVQQAISELRKSC